jgi:hypothetical protein
MQLLKRFLVGSFRSAKSSSAPRIRVPAVLGLLVCSQAVWSQQVSISPSPSYDGSYTVSFADFPLGCNSSDGVYFCNTLQEQVGNTATGSWYAPAGSTSMNFSGKSANTYGYGVWVDWWWEDQSGSYFIGPTWVQVSLPLPDPNSYYYPVGPANNPSSYVFGWNAANADSCDLDLRWYVTPPYQGAAHLEYTGRPTTEQWNVGKEYTVPPRTDHVQARVTCHGPGGSTPEEWRLEFNESLP